MDGSQNFEPFDGLPHELWATQQMQQHQQQVASSRMHTGYSNPSLQQAMRDLANPQLQAEAFTSGAPMPSLAPSQQAFSNLPSVPKTQLAPHSTSQYARTDRSAWSHMLSLDPTVAALASYESSTHPFQPPKYVTPGMNAISKAQGLSTLHPQILSQSPFLNIPNTHYASTTSGLTIPHHSYREEFGTKTSPHLGHLMNLSKKEAKLPSASNVFESLTVDTNVSNAQSSSYSPVSPPAGDNKPSAFLNIPSSNNSSQFSGLGLQNPQYLHEPSHIFDTRKSTSLSESSLYSNLAASAASDMPLDMTTDVSLRANRPKSEDIPNKDGSDQLASSEASPSQRSADSVPLLHQLLNKPRVSNPESFRLGENNPRTVSSSAETTKPPVVVSDVAIGKIQKAMKKSNFYGRESSSFSTVTNSDLLDSGESVLQSSKKESKQQSNELKKVENCSDLSVLTHKEENDDNKAFTMDSSQFMKLGSDITDTGLMMGLDHAGDDGAFYPDHKLTDYSLEDGQTADSFIDACTLSPRNDANLASTASLDSDPKDIEEKDSPMDGESNPLDGEVKMENSMSLGMTDDSFGLGVNTSDFGELGQSDEKEVESHSVSEHAQSFNESVIVKAKPVRGRKRKNAATPGGKRKRGAKTVAFPSVPESSDKATEDSISANQPDIHLDNNDGKVSETAPLPVPKRGVRARGRGRGRGANSAGKSEDGTESNTRRSSSRKSKDNAMRLIELQADTGYNGISHFSEQELEPIVPSPMSVPPEGRKRKAAASLKNFAESDISDEEDEQGDEKDVDYFVDEEEAAALDQEEELALQETKKLPKEKKIGGLKISIKLGSDSQAQIVSNNMVPVKKKRKESKKPSKKKSKSRIKVPESLSTSEDESSQISEPQKAADTEEKKEPEQKTDTRDDQDGSEESKEMSLMDKYFSTSKSLAAAKQLQKNNAQNKESSSNKNKVLKKKSPLQSKLKKKGLMNKSTGQGKVSINEVKKDDGLGKTDTEATEGKFVCGYCPRRYNNKQELLAHVEDHMNEMEGKGGATEEKKSEKSVTLDSSAPKTLGEPMELFKLGETKNPKIVPLSHKFNCGECGEFFPTKPAFLEHVRIHAAEKPFECDICHKFFKERTLLSEHRKTHVQDKLVRCPLCNKAFIHQIDLEAHMKSHPKRSGGPVGPVKVLKPSQSFKKKVHIDKESVSLPKPKSFASALSGETDSPEKSSPNSTLVLKRSEQSPVSASSGGKSKGPVISEPKPSLGSKNSATSISSKDSISIPISQTDSSPSANVGEKKIEESSDPGHCTCKECPECVTRFLQSFDT